MKKIIIFILMFMLSVSIVNAVSISDGVYNGNFFAFGTEENSPTTMIFNNDGSKMYILGITNDRVYEYDLSINYQINSSVYNSNSFSVGTEETDPSGISFNNDGSKMYVVGYGTDKVYEYDLGTNYQINSSVYNSNFFSVLGQATTPRDIGFNNDGSKMYMLAQVNNAVYEYDLGTNYQINSSVYNSNFISTSPESSTDAMDFAFSPDGSKMFFIGTTTDKAYEYNLTTNFDITSAIYSGNSLSTLSQDSNPRGIAFNTDGSKMYMTGDTNDRVYEYDYSTPLFPFPEITINSINLIDNGYYNTNNLSLELELLNSTTSGDINSSYSLNGASFIQFGTNTLRPNLTLTSLSDGINNITFKLENTETQTNITYSFEIFPLQYVYFKNSSNSTINNFYINDILYNNTFKFRIYEYGFGDISFNFSKLGFKTSSFILNLNSTSLINTSFNVPGARIFFEFIDVVTGDYIEGGNQTNVQVIGDSYATIFNTSNRNYTLQDLSIIADTYNVIISNADYEAVATTFEYTNKEYLNLTIYMTPIALEDVADLIIEVQDLEGNVQKEITTYQYIFDTTILRDVLINQKATDYRGQTSYKVILNTRSYTFCAEYNDELFCVNDVVININTDKVIIPIDKTILEETRPSNIYNVDFPFSLTNTTNPLTNFSLIKFIWTNDAQNLDNYCLAVYEYIGAGRSSVFDNCNSNHNSELTYSADLSNGNKYYAEAYVILDGERRIVDTLTINVDFELEDALKYYGLQKLAALVLLIIGVSIGLSKKVHNITFTHIGISLAYLFISLLFPSIFGLDIFFVVLLINLSAISLFTKRDDAADKAKIRNILKILSLYIILIFSLSFLLADLDDKGLLDDKGQDLYLYLTDGDDAELNELDAYIETTQQSLNQTKENTLPGGEDKTDNTLTTFIKLLGWVNLFFSIISKVFTIPSTLYYMLGFTTPFLTSLMAYISFVFDIALFKVFYDALFGK